MTTVGVGVALRGVFADERMDWNHLCAASIVINVRESRSLKSLERWSASFPLFIPVAWCLCVAGVYVWTSEAMSSLSMTHNAD